MDAIFLIFPIVAVICVLVYKNKIYKETTYYQISKNPYFFMDKGTRGEYLIYEHLRHFEDDGGKFLFNIYLPKANKETTEIDVLLITLKGLFVIESKNYGGWIFGNDAHRNWTQTFPMGRGRSRKERFYNPVMQNISHITHLKRLIGENFPMWSIIVFSDECTFRDVTIRNRNVHVIKRHEVASVVAQIHGQTHRNNLTEAEINGIFARLYPYTQVNSEIRKQHIRGAQRYLQSD
ncbi:MAG TPA: hypothetical protein DEA55_00540 [Rhodospirillaceae bacterium]|nr:hypothetical protein [Rhodospirillaceae bacterium]